MVNYDGFLEIMQSLLIILLLIFNKTLLIQIQYMIIPIVSEKNFYKTHFIIMEHLK